MKTYSEIIGINKNFCPYYDLLNEREDAWKQFIPTPQFFDLLSKTLDALDDGNLSVWLQGAYGTGKSHATGLIKHLLYLDWKDLKLTIGNWSNAQNKARLEKFRDDNRVFPVVMYGSDKITNQIDFGLQIEIGVRRAFDKAGIKMSTPTEFETYADAIEKDKSNYWDLMIQEEYTVGELVQDKQSMINKLRGNDQDLFMAIREALNQRGRPIAVKDIISWLKDITAYLRKQKIASHMMIYWDEFTTILDKNNSDIHTEIQKIVEASSETGVFLFLISHRAAVQGLRKEDREKLLGRFKDVTYEMSDVTTYHLISHAIQKLDHQQWAAMQEKHSQAVSTAIEYISEIDLDGNPNDLRNLFPIHPYTAHVTSYIARVLGSTERSIFNFLNDREYGFAFFIANCPGNEEIDFLTLDYVFDFFQNVFADQSEAFFASLMQRYKNNLRSLEEENKLYGNLFKALLMINIANYKSNVSEAINQLVVPNKENLLLALSGTKLSRHIDEFLAFIDKRKIIVKDHEGRYLVDAANIDQAEIAQWINFNESKYTSIPDIFANVELELLSPILSNHKRSSMTSAFLMDAEMAQHQIQQKITSKISNKAKLNVLFIIARDLSHLKQVKETLEAVIPNTPDPLCFMVLDRIFGQEDWERYLNFKAASEIAQKHHNDEASAANRKNMKEHLKKWISTAKKQGFVEWFVKDKDSKVRSGSISYDRCHEAIDRDICRTIYHQSFDTMGNRLNSMTAWEKKTAKSCAKHYLSSTSFGDLSQKNKSGREKESLNILYTKSGELVVNEKLKFISGEKDHPLYLCMAEIDSKLSGKDEVNLANALESLFRAPFGYFPNYIFLPAVAFAFRKYLGKLYSVQTGEILSSDSLLDLIIKVFKYHNDNTHSLKESMQVRLGSENEIRLVKLLEEIFELDDCSSILDTRHKLKKRITETTKMPLWLFNYSDLDDATKMAIDLIREKIIPIQVGDTPISDSTYKYIYEEIDKNRSALTQAFKYNDVSVVSKLMKEFVISIDDKVKSFYKDSHFDSLYKFLCSNLPTDPIYWEEEKTRSTVFQWMISMTLPPPPPDPWDGENSGKGGSEQGSTSFSSLQELNRKIDNFQGDLKQVLKDFIAQHENYLGLFSQIFRDHDDA